MTSTMHHDRPRLDSALTRRDLIAALASVFALPLLSACNRHGASMSATSSDGAAIALLDDVAEHLLRLAPEQATSLGIDTGARASLRSMLADRSAEGQQRL